MTDTQNITKAITQVAIEATRALVKAMAVTTHEAGTI